jgi:hypothetical protein
MNNNNNNYPGQVEQMAAQAASNILEVKPAIPAQAAPRRTAPGQSRAASPRNAHSAQPAPAREAPVRERRAGFDWNRFAGRAGYAPPYVRAIAGVGGLGVWLVSGYITAQSLGNNELLSWAIVVMMSVIQLVIWYMYGLWWFVLPALILMGVSIWLNIGAVHIAYNYNVISFQEKTWRFQLDSSKAWLYAVIGFFFDMAPEPMIKLAFTGRLVESKR